MLVFSARNMYKIYRIKLIKIIMKTIYTFSMTINTSSWFLQYGAYVFFISSARSTNAVPENINKVPDLPCI